MSGAKTGAGYRSELADVAPAMHTNVYNNRFGAEMQRVNALDPKEAQFPALEVYSFKTLDLLYAAAQGYLGNVTIIKGPSDYERIVHNDERPVDFFALQSDGSVVRSNRFGQPNEALRDLVPDTDGALATGEVGEGSGVGTGGSPSTGGGTPPDNPEPNPNPGSQTVGFFGFKSRYKIDTSKPMEFAYGTSKFGTPEVTPDVPATGSIVVPAGMEGKGVQIDLSELTTGVGAKTLVITCDGDEVLNWGPEQMGGGIANVAATVGKDFPKPNIYGTVVVTATVDRPCALALQWKFPDAQ